MVFVCSRSRIVDHVPGRVPDGDALDRRGIDEVQIAQADYSVPQLGALRADEMDGATDDSTARGEGIGRHERETAETQRGYSFHGEHGDLRRPQRQSPDYGNDESHLAIMFRTSPAPSWPPVPSRVFRPGSPSGF